MFPRDVVDLPDSMPHDSLKCDGKLDRIKVVNIMMAMSWKATSAWNHEAEVGVSTDGRRALRISLSSPVAATGDEITHVGACKVTMERHMFGSKIVFL